MRNLALAMAETDLVIMLDADFLVGPRSFEDSLRDPANYAAITSLLRARRAVMVLPALEYNQTLEGAAAGKARTLAAARAGGRRGAVDALRAGALVPFHGRYHERTDYARWAAARDPAENATAAEEAGDGGGGSGIAGGVDGDELGAAVPRSLLSFEAAPNATGVTGGAASPGDAAGYFYEVEYPPALRRRRVTVVNPTYEPYVMALREQLPDPLWDERFRGYHLNKIEVGGRIRVSDTCETRLYWYACMDARASASWSARHPSRPVATHCGAPSHLCCTPSAAPHLTDTFPRSVPPGHGVPQSFGLPVPGAPGRLRAALAAQQARAQGEGPGDY